MTMFKRPKEDEKVSLKPTWAPHKTHWLNKDDPTKPTYESTLFAARIEGKSVEAGCVLLRSIQEQLCNYDVKHIEVIDLHFDTLDSHNTESTLAFRAYLTDETRRALPEYISVWIKEEGCKAVTCDRYRASDFEMYFPKLANLNEG